MWLKILLDEFYYQPPESIRGKLRIRLEDMLNDLDVEIKKHHRNAKQVPAKMERRYNRQIERNQRGGER